MVLNMNGLKDGDDPALNQRIQDEMTDSLDGELELELDDSRLDQLVSEIAWKRPSARHRPACLFQRIIPAAG
jgi:hypothetical protein